MCFIGESEDQCIWQAQSDTKLSAAQWVQARHISSFLCVGMLARQMNILVSIRYSSSPQPGGEITVGHIFQFISFYVYLE